MTACPDCTAAAAQLWHGYHDHCHGCMVRALAKSPRHIREQAYTQALHQGRSMADVRELQQAVKAEHDRLQALKIDAIKRAQGDSNSLQLPRYGLTSDRGADAILASPGGIGMSDPPTGPSREADGAGNSPPDRALVADSGISPVGNPRGA